MEEYKLDKLLILKGFSLSCAESLTGGEFASFITSKSGASKYFKGGIVSYSNSIKQELGVNKQTLDQFGAVSKQVASEMVIKASEFFKSDVSVSFTGNAGPSALENKPVGLVYIGIKIKDQIYVYENMFNGDRNQIRNKCVEFAIEVLTSLLED